jgi:uncharacterized protein DUF1844
LAEHKNEETFKVIDRRPFTAEGELRKEAIEEERRETEAAAKRPATKDGAKDGTKAQATPDRAAAPAASASGAAGSNVAGSGAAAGAALAPETATDDIAGEKPASSRHFQMLIDFLARNAAAMLGGMADPRTGQAFLDLEGAREMIDMLDVLREKTSGNLSHEDDALLLEVIGSLKLTFMEISKAAAAQAGKEKARVVKP